MGKVTHCPCIDTSCEFNPENHDQGCNLCIADSIKTKEIPKCFFQEAGGDIDVLDAWSFEAFAQIVLNR